MGKVAVHRCATCSLDTRRPRVLRRSASSLEQPSSAHKTYLLHGRLLKELEIFTVFRSILTLVFLSVFLFYVFILLFGALVMFLSHLRRLNLDLVDRLIDVMEFDSGPGGMREFTKSHGSVWEKILLRKSFYC